MKLSTEDTALFYRLMWGLQIYVNQQRKVLPGVDSVEDYAALPGAERIKVRSILWENPELIDAYVAQNPDGLPSDELDIVRKWQRFVAGAFQIFRYLKKHTISRSATCPQGLQGAGSGPATKTTRTRSLHGWHAWEQDRMERTSMKAEPTPYQSVVEMC